MTDPLVTFVVPTLGRPTLGRTLASLDRQTDDGWQAVVGFDGVEPPEWWYWRYRRWKVDGGRVDCGSAGITRNALMSFASGTCGPHYPWFAFVDDDDAVSGHYVSLLREVHEERPDVDCVVFRMRYADGLVLPDPAAPALTWGQVGISFAFRSWLFERSEGVRFVREALDRPGPDGNEDIQMLRQLQRAGASTYIHPSVAYYVRHDPEERE